MEKSNSFKNQYFSFRFACLVYFFYGMFLWLLSGEIFSLLTLKSKTTLILFISKRRRMTLKCNVLLKYCTPLPLKDCELDKFKHLKTTTGGSAC